MLNNAKGALYQLSQIAALSLEGKQVVGVERSLSTVIYKQTKTGVKVKAGEAGRKIDIVVQNGDSEKHIEVKSYIGYDASGKMVGHNKASPVWDNLGQKKTFLMKEFFQDRIYAGADLPASKIEWRFDEFNVKDNECGGKVKGFDSKVLEELRPNMLVLPKWFVNAHSKAMFGMSESAYNLRFSGQIDRVVVSKGLWDTVATGKMNEFLPEDLKMPAGENNLLALIEEFNQP